ncbi:ABC transporter permease [Caldimonas brevitalea]|uniref:Peptide ABC transporter permease n=1 Tax=Caldimonas brevitalea TaxID=413882 RepID=A0A0G3BMI9_9BURK|nr:ABC transporter permease [Caldimonas brevitalea]AKJ29198.1 peptide ABC transporter permease [Caldimonas brevitalea]
MGFKFVWLWTDVVLWALVACLAFYVARVRRSPPQRAKWASVFRDAAAACSAVVLLVFLVVALADSLHFRRALPSSGSQQAEQAYDPRVESVLDLALARQIAMREPSYSEPLAYRGFVKETVEVDGRPTRAFPRLPHGGAHLKDPAAEWGGDVVSRGLTGALLGLVSTAVLVGLIAVGVARRDASSVRVVLARLARDQTDLPWRAATVTVALIALVAGAVIGWMDHYHVLGTDRTGNDVLYQALKSVRTAFVIGSLATIATLPFAIALGIAAGYFKGWVDEVIQYLYTTLSSVPNVLLIAACVLMVQVFIDKNPELFQTGAERSDVRILLLCLILGVTGWASLCRLLRAETLKLRELDFVQAATAFGVGPLRIMGRHILPNVMHLVLITTVLEFSSLILYEAVLSYVGVGVDPSMNSFGGMINLARSELSREPTVWWSVSAAFAFMVTLVLAANLFADGVREAFDPRGRSFRARLATRTRPAA